MKYKFRLWDVRENIMSEPRELTYEGRWWGRTIDIDNHRLVEPCGEDNKNYIVMQFTGLHDKNGSTDIYGGDIVEGEHGVKAIIEWTQEFGRWSMRWSDGSTTPISWHVKHATVIGNVHENPDLLK